jgi:hypothetical protein
MTVSFSQDDYNTWSTGRAVNLQASRSQLYMNGASRRRAYQFLSTSNVPIRLEAAELDFDIGEMDQSQGMGVSPTTHQR